MNDTDNPQALAVREADPVQMMRVATDVASVCKAIVVKTAVNIQGKKYVKCEGWMAIATAHGCMAGSREVKRVDGGWTAIGEIRRISDGVILSTAEGFVGENEKRWATADEYACRAMAQTRAISRACRAAFAHVVVLMDSGLSTTPAEEVPEGGFDRAKPVSPVRPPATPPAASAPPSRPPVAFFPTEASKEKLMVALEDCRYLAEEFFQKVGWLMPNEKLEDLNLRHVPATARNMKDLQDAIAEFGDGQEAVAPYPAHKEPSAKPEPRERKAKEIEVPRDKNCDPNSPDAPWRSFPVPWGKQAGTQLAKMDKAALFGWWANYEVETEYNGKPKSAATIAKDTLFREMLDEAGKHYEFINS